MRGNMSPALSSRTRYNQYKNRFNLGRLSWRLLPVSGNLDFAWTRIRSLLGFYRSSPGVTSEPIKLGQFTLQPA